MLENNKHDDKHDDKYYGKYDDDHDNKHGKMHGSRNGIDVFFIKKMTIAISSMKTSMTTNMVRCMEVELT